MVGMTVVTVPDLVCVWVMMSGHSTNRKEVTYRQALTIGLSLLIQHVTMHVRNHGIGICDCYVCIHRELGLGVNS